MSTKILIAEDDEHTREALQEVLTLEDFDVVATSNGIDAFESFQRERPDIVCLDVMMPGMNGYEVCKKIRRMDETVPILFLTAKSEEIDTVLGLELGADDYMTKPFALRELEARVHALLRRSQGDFRQEHVLGRLRFDTFRQEFYAGDQPLRLPLREHGVLEALMLQPGRVVSKDRIAQRLAVGAEDLADNAIEVYIHRLRRRLAPEGVRIRTLRGLGYLLEASSDESAA